MQSFSRSPASIGQVGTGGVYSLGRPWIAHTQAWIMSFGRCTLWNAKLSFFGVTFLFFADYVSSLLLLLLIIKNESFVRVPSCLGVI